MAEFHVRNEEIEGILRKLGKLIASVMPKGWGFALFIYDFTEKPKDGSIFYISNGQREDMIKTLEEFIENNNDAKSMT